MALMMMALKLIYLARKRHIIDHEPSLTMHPLLDARYDADVCLIDSLELTATRP
jgi:hypothetical protein